MLTLAITGFALNFIGLIVLSFVFFRSSDTNFRRSCIARIDRNLSEIELKSGEDHRWSEVQLDITRQNDKLRSMQGQIARLKSSGRPKTTGSNVVDTGDKLADIFEEMAIVQNGGGQPVALVDSPTVIVAPITSE